ncbi:MAG: 50S ribosomal protein L9 [bacterium]|nr:50S ribosomal protein L9 [bacterium]
MKILLLQDIKGIGRKYDVKEVKEGYARNFLLPRKLAVVADERALSMKAESEIYERTLLDKNRALAKDIENQAIVFKVKTGDKKEVFGSIKKEDIKKVLIDRGFDIVDVILPHPLKKIGDHSVEIAFGRGIKGRAMVTLQSIEE